MRRLFTVAESGLTYHALIWGERTGKWRRVQQGIYADGPEDPTPLDRERAKVIASGSPARGGLGGALLGLDSVTLDGASTRRTPRGDVTVIEDTPCADAMTILVDLAATLDDDTWEQALESALRKRLVRLGDLEQLPPKVPGVRRIRRVLARRGDVPPTESLLETLMVQMIRRAGLPDPLRQYVVTTRDGTFVARVDLCWPDLGIFVELDGQQHKDQPVYDANRQTRVVTATGWLVGRFTWREVVHTPKACERRLKELLDLRLHAQASEQKSSMRARMTSRLAVQKASSATSMPKRDARSRAEPRPHDDRRSS
jgi:very-short-patch-repair endonuclease